MIKLLFIGIQMDMGGTEKALLSLLQALDPKRYDVSLLLAQHKGCFMESIPKHITVLPPITNGVLFTLSRYNALSVIRRLHFSGKYRYFHDNADLIYNAIRKKDAAPEKLFLSLMEKACPLFSQEHPHREYDVAIAFSGDRTMFYLCDKICCRTKISFLHFDWRYPHRDYNIYHDYFSRCDGVFSVSKSCTNLLKSTFPDISNKFLTFYNVIPKSDILSQSKTGPHLPKAQNGEFRILSIMRICHQKGADRIPHIIRKLVDHGIMVRWYIVGDGSKRFISQIKLLAKELKMDNRMILLGLIDNPYTMLRECDLFVLPSRYEGMPIVVEEAKLLKAPIVCTSYLSANEQLDHGRLGMIGGQSIDGIANAIQSALAIPENRIKTRMERDPFTLKTRDIHKEWGDLLGIVNVL